MSANDFGISKSVLLVDDDEDLREVLEYDLKSKGFRVYMCENAVEALELLTKDKLHLDIIISDIQMPKIDGMQFFHESKNRIPATCKFFFMTGFSKYKQADVVAMGASGLIEKPIDREVFLKMMKEAIEN